MNRRQLLQAGLGAAGSLGLPTAFVSQAHADNLDLGFDLTKGSRTLNLVRPASGERLHFEYMRDGVWLGDSYNYICWLLRDVRAGKHVRMDTRLIAILDWTQRYLSKYGYTEPIHILSGYRSPETNTSTEGAKKNSLHLEGRAVDIHIPGLSADYLAKLLSWLSQGGVGAYSDRHFIHIDTGRVRKWGA